MSVRSPQETAFIVLGTILTSSRKDRKQKIGKLVNPRNQITLDLLVAAERGNLREELALRNVVSVYEMTSKERRRAEEQIARAFSLIPVTMRVIRPITGNNYTAQTY